MEKRRTRRKLKLFAGRTQLPQLSLRRYVFVYFVIGSKFCLFFMSFQIDRNKYWQRWAGIVIFHLIVISFTVEASDGQCDSEENCTKHESNNYAEGKNVEI
jgi:hypothetical protein